MNGNRVWLTIAIFVIVQTAGAVWWAGSISTDVKYIKRDIKKIEKTIEQVQTDLATII